MTARALTENESAEPLGWDSPPGLSPNLGGRRLGFGMEKKCPRCKEIKPAAQFHKSNKTSDGLRWCCKTCANRARAEYRKTDRGKQLGREADRRYFQTPKGKETRRRNDATYIRRNKEKRIAVNALQSAMTAGKIKKPAHCSACPVKITTEGHHWDYSRALVVRWLCPPCHRELHEWAREYKRYYLSLGEAA